MPHFPANNKCHVYLYPNKTKKIVSYKITKYVSLKQLLLSTQMRDKITESFGIPKEIRWAEEST